jgi:hypothetical protein
LPYQLCEVRSNLIKSVALTCFADLPFRRFFLPPASATAAAGALLPEPPPRFCRALSIAARRFSALQHATSVACDQQHAFMPTFLSMYETRAMQDKAFEACAEPHPMLAGRLQATFPDTTSPIS